MDAPDELALDMTGVGKRFGPSLVRDDVTFRVGKGTVHGLVGHNGAGKSTLINMLAGNVSPDTGEILVDGEPQSFAGPRGAQRAGRPAA